jgi:lipopolysaccharide biosynthesis glycosyltransferase
MKKAEIGIVLASDSNYLPFVWPLVRDLKRILSSCPPVILMFDGEIRETEKLQKLSEDAGINLSIYDISEELSEEYFNTIRYITRATFARYFAAQKLKDDFAKILYLDIDILIVRDFSFVFNLEMTQTIAAVAENFDSVHKAFGTFDFSYFNAGVLLVDTQRWNEENALAKCLKVTREKGPFNCQDQDALNLVFENRWQALPPTCNVMISSHDHSYDLPQFNSPAIVHFVGEHKPWKKVQWTRWHKMWNQRNADLIEDWSNSVRGSDYRGHQIWHLKHGFRTRYVLLECVRLLLKSRIIRGITRRLRLKNVKALRSLLGLDNH